MIRIEDVDAVTGSIPICGANFTGTVLTAPVNAEFRWDANKDSSDVVVKLTAELPGLADYEFVVSAAVTDFPGLSSINGLNRPSTLDGSMPFELTQVVQNLSIITAIVNHCAEQRGGSPEDARQIVIKELYEYLEKQPGLNAQSNLQLLAGLQQSWNEPGILKIKGVFDAETGGYERFDLVTFNGGIVDTSVVSNQVRPRVQEAEISLRKNASTGGAKKKKATLSKPPLNGGIPLSP